MTTPVIEFTSRDMIGVLRQRPRPTSLFTQWFGGRRIKHKTKFIQLDKVGGNNMIARYTNRVGGSNKLSRGTFDSTVFVAPYVYEEFNYTPSMLDERMPGQTEYDVSPDANAAAFLVDSLDELETRLDNLEEKQYAEAFQTGKVTVTGEGVDYEVDYGATAGHLITLSGGAEWDEPTTNDIPGNLQTWASLIEDKGAPTPNVLIGDQASMNLFKADAGIIANLDNRRVDVGMINPQYNPMQRVTYVGTYRDIGVDLQLYTYNGKYDYLDGSGVKQTANFMNTNTVIMTSLQQSIDFHFGKIENFKAPGFQAERFPNQWESEDGRNRAVTMESSPLLGYKQPDAIVSVVVA